MALVTRELEPMVEIPELMVETPELMVGTLELMEVTVLLLLMSVSLPSLPSTLIPYSLPFPALPFFPSSLNLDPLSLPRPTFPSLTPRSCVKTTY